MRHMDITVQYRGTNLCLMLGKPTTAVHYMVFTHLDLEVGLWFVDKLGIEEKQNIVQGILAYFDQTEFQNETYQAA
jgi:hypothetical protein